MRTPSGGAGAPPPPYLHDAFWTLRGITLVFPLIFNALLKLGRFGVFVQMLVPPYNMPR